MYYFILKVYYLFSCTIHVVEMKTLNNNINFNNNEYLYINYQHCPMSTLMNRNDPHVKSVEHFQLRVLLLPVMLQQ